MAKIKNFNFKTYSKILPIGMVVKHFCQKYKIQIFVKNLTFFFGFSIVVQQNQGVQLKDRLF